MSKRSNQIITIDENEGFLRRVAEEIPQKDIPSKETKNLIKHMAEILAMPTVGVGLAAPQIAVSKRIFIVLKKEFLSERNSNEQKRGIPAIEKIDIFINPQIIKKSKNKVLLHEGCLSVPDLYGNIKRHEKVTIRAYNEKGQKIERGASGLFAEIFQHEIDHLDGILFIDTATNLEKNEPSHSHNS